MLNVDHGAPVETVLVLPGGSVLLSAGAPPRAASPAARARALTCCACTFVRQAATM
ncbi:MAG: hypothetical protein ACK4ZJ_10350 [Allorhizobium sp.]